MKEKMRVVYAPEKAPEKFSKSIFLAGPSPREATHANWRPEALKLLEEIGYDGIVFIPLPRDGNWAHSYDDQIDWETEHLNMSDIVAFWIPRDMMDLPALTTNVEFGMWFDSGKAVLGYPEGAPHMRYLTRHAKSEQVPIFNSLEETLKESVKRIGAGAERVLGERMIPLHIWNLTHFQQWLKAQKNAGNRLDKARVLWSFRVNPTKNFIFDYAIQVDVYITAENRHKTNEIIISRPDIATIVAYHPNTERTLDTEVVLIREFRSPARTTDGFIREVPGGSSWKPAEDPFSTAAHELDEETGFTIAPERFRKIGDRQLCGTLSTHQAHVFACEITKDELTQLKKQQTSGTAHGVTVDTEQTYVEIYRLGDLLKTESNAVDWSMLGMILTTLSDKFT